MTLHKDSAPAEIIDEWVRRLRDGRPQVQRKLHTPQGQCCLGVLCEMAFEAGVVDRAFRDTDRGDERYFYDGTDSVLPPSVYTWAGLPDENPDLPTSDIPDVRYITHRMQAGAAFLNDNGVPFLMIADAIEKAGWAR